VTGILDKFEDPSDVYRVTFAARTEFRVTVTSQFGDPDVAVFDQSKRNVSQRAVARSNRSERATDRVVVYNATRHQRSAWVQAYIDPRAEGLDAGYRLTIHRVHYRG
jgi:hypothetical protein